MGFISKINSRKAEGKSIETPYYNDISKELIPAIVNVRGEIGRLIKNLEKEPALKKEVIDWFGTGFVDDLVLVAKLAEALKK